jgi:hypothetical protein
LTEITPFDLAQPISFSVVAERVSGGVGQVLSGYAGGSLSDGAAGFSATANDAQLFAGSTIAASAPTGSYHYMQMVADGAISSINVDGVAGLTQNAGTGGTGSAGLSICSNQITGTPQYLTGNVSEAGLWPFGLTTAEQTALYNNESGRW